MKERVKLESEKNKLDNLLNNNLLKKLDELHADLQVCKLGITFSMSGVTLSGSRVTLSRYWITLSRSGITLSRGHFINVWGRFY